MIWPLLALASLLVHVTGYIVSPIALLFCGEDDEHLPAWAWPWDNPQDGINGDGNVSWGWRGPEHANGRERTYWWRLLWLYRNAGYGFAEYAGATLLEYPQATGPDVSDQSGATGCRYVTARASVAGVERQAWERYIVLRYPGTRKCFRLRMGWKLNGCVPGERAILVVSVSPWKACR